MEEAADVSNLFRIKRARRPELWHFIRLIPKAGLNKPPSEMTNDDAVAAYCLPCRMQIRFEKFRNDAAKHMKAFHPEQLLPPRSSPSKPNQAKSEKPSPATQPMVSKEQQNQFNALVAQWISASMRPIACVEDPGLVAIVRFLSSEIGGFQIGMPKRGQVRDEIVHLAERKRHALREQLQSNCLFYSLTTDIWTDRCMRSYISLTIHYVDEAFHLRNYVLEVEKFPGKHDAPAIAHAMTTAAARWNIDLSRCTRLLRDGAANAVAGADRLGVESMSCIAHALHLVLGGALVKRLAPKRRGSTHSAASAASSPRCTAQVSESRGIWRVPDLGERQPWTMPELSESDLIKYVDEVIDDLSVAEMHADEERYGENDIVISRIRDEAVKMVDNHTTRATEKHPVAANALTFVRTIVAKFRSIAVYFHRSAKGKSALNHVQRQKGKGTPLTLILDCPTRWNSTYLMLARFIEIKDYLDDFFDYLRSEDGRKEFRDIAIDRPSVEDWRVITGLAHILKHFDAVTRFVSGQSYPTLSAVFPCLESIKKRLLNLDMLACYESPPSDTIMLDEARKAILMLFMDRFKDVSNDLRWITFLDPRFVSTPVYDKRAKDADKMRILDALQEMAEADRSPSTPVQADSFTAQANPLTSPNPTPKKEDIELDLDIFEDERRTQQVPCVPDQTDEMLRVRLGEELEEYLKMAGKTAMKTTDTMKWWRDNSNNFPNVARLARKWLGCVATSVSSERAFSASGNIVTAKRANLKPELVRDLVFLAQNRDL